MPELNTYLQHIKPQDGDDDKNTKATGKYPPEETNKRKATVQKNLIPPTIEGVIKTKNKLNEKK